jgi:hypothetical protein
MNAKHGFIEIQQSLEGVFLKKKGGKRWKKGERSKRSKKGVFYPFLLLNS